MGKIDPEKYRLLEQLCNNLIRIRTAYRDKIRSLGVESSNNFLDKPEEINKIPGRNAIPLYDGMTLSESDWIELPQVLSDWSNLTKADNMFLNCHQLQRTGEIKSRSLFSMRGICSGCYDLKEILNLDYSWLREFSSAYQNCYSINKAVIKFGGNLQNISQAFSGCTSLKIVELTNLSGCSNLNGSFINCSELVNLKLTGLNPKSELNTTSMIDGCKSLTSLIINGNDNNDSRAFQNAIIDIPQETQKSLVELWSNEDIGGFIGVNKCERLKYFCVKSKYYSSITKKNSFNVWALQNHKHLEQIRIKTNRNFSQYFFDYFNNFQPGYSIWQDQKTYPIVDNWVTKSGPDYKQSIQQSVSQNYESVYGYNDTIMVYANNKNHLVLMNSGTTRLLEMDCSGLEPWSINLCIDNREESVDYERYLSDRIVDNTQNQKNRFSFFGSLEEVRLTNWNGGSVHLVSAFNYKNKILSTVNIPFLYKLHTAYLQGGNWEDIIVRDIPQLCNLTIKGNYYPRNIDITPQTYYDRYLRFHDIIITRPPKPVNWSTHHKYYFRQYNQSNFDIDISANSGFHENNDYTIPANGGAINIGKVIFDLNNRDDIATKLNFKLHNIRITKDIFIGNFWLRSKNDYNQNYSKDVFHGNVITSGVVTKEYYYLNYFTNYSSIDYEESNIQISYTSYMGYFFYDGMPYFDRYGYTFPLTGKLNFNNIVSRAGGKINFDIILPTDIISDDRDTFWNEKVKFSKFQNFKDVSKYLFQFSNDDSYRFTVTIKTIDATNLLSQIIQEFSYIDLHIYFNQLQSIASSLGLKDVNNSRIYYHGLQLLSEINISSGSNTSNEYHLIDVNRLQLVSGNLSGFNSLSIEGNTNNSMTLNDIISTRTEIINNTTLTKAVVSGVQNIIFRKCDSLKEINISNSTSDALFVNCQLSNIIINLSSNNTINKLAINCNIQKLTITGGASLSEFTISNSWINGVYYE